MGLEPGRMAEAIARNARIRDEGTRNLLTAAAAAGARRVVAKASRGLTRRDQSRIGRVILWTSALSAAEPSACAALQPSNIGH